MSAVVTVKGKVLQDGELKFLPDGKPLLKTKVASSYKKAGEWVSDVYSVTVWGEKAEQLSILKGMRVEVSGPLKFNTYKTRDDVEKIDPQINTEDVTILDSAISTVPSSSDNDSIPF
jgi:single-stranded DNA-binding protein